MTTKPQRGLALLATLVLLMLVGVSMLTLQTHAKATADTKAQQHARTAQSLQTIRQNLLMFASLQGYNSHTQLGHLPCPAPINPEEDEDPLAPQTTCNKTPWGYLPIRSIAKTNYLNPSLAAQWNLSDMDANKQWMYAVSQQVLQPNKLGWSQWVNFALPSLTVHTESGIYSGIVAVVAENIAPIPEQTSHYQASDPVLLLTQTELQHTIRKAQRAAIQNTLHAWKGNGRNHENLVQTPSPQTSTLNWTAQTSGCQCLCTKTQCKCQCDAEGQWTSTAPCTNETGTAACTQNTQSLAYTCTSTATQMCIFKGPAQLASAWPISRFDPVPRADTSCTPSAQHICPLDPKGDGCLCAFEWPDNTLKNLGDFAITSTPQTPPVFSVAP
jgi:type II secretory pathway pseudopilin PulG